MRAIKNRFVQCRTVTGVFLAILLLLNAKITNAGEQILFDNLSLKSGMVPLVIRFESHVYDCPGCRDTPEPDNIQFCADITLTIKGKSGPQEAVTTGDKLCSEAGIKRINNMNGDGTGDYVLDYTFAVAIPANTLSFAVTTRIRTEHAGEYNSKEVKSTFVFHRTSTGEFTPGSKSTDPFNLFWNEKVVCKLNVTCKQS